MLRLHHQVFQSIRRVEISLEKPQVTMVVACCGRALLGPTDRVRW